MSKFLLVTVIFGLWLNVAAYSQQPPPPNPLYNRSWAPTLKRVPTDGLLMGRRKVLFGTTPLREVSTEAGRVPIQHQGDAGESIYWVCFDFQPLQRRQRIWLISDGEMGGTEHRVTAIAAQFTDANSGGTDCPELPEPLTPLSIAQTLWLGIPEADVSKILGVPSHTGETWTSYDYAGKRKGTCLPDGFDVTSWFAFKKQEGRVVGIYAGQIVSC